MDCEEEEAAAGSFSELYVDGVMEIFVTAINGKNMTFEVDGSAKVLDVAVAIEEAIGIPIDQMRLIFGGRAMKMEKTLAEFGVEDRSHLYCRLCLHGGGRGEYVLSFLSPSQHVCFQA